MDQWHNREHQITANFSKKLSENEKQINEILKDCDDIVKKEFRNEKDLSKKIFLCYTDGLVKTEMIEESIIRPFLKVMRGTEEKTEDWLLALYRLILETADVKEGKTMDTMIEAVLSGNTVLFADGYNRGLIISTKGFPVRGISEPESEVVMRGSKDSFNENLRTNTALIRRRIKDTRLKVKQSKVGKRSRTNVAILYIEDLAKSELVEQIQKEINEIIIDGILDNGMLEHLLEKNPFSPFPQYQNTERPDKVASALLEGRIAIVVDNSPGVLLVPVTFHCFFQASDDYYNRFYVASFERILRYVAAFLSIGMPGLYIAILNFHTEVLPTNLVLNFGAARLGVPFPVVVELLLMELAFELLREAGVRMPGQMGNTIGVVGGLIVGQAAVEAGLVSTIVVIIVSLTAIASFSIPNESFTSVFRLLKFLLIGTCAIWGIYGFFIGMLAVLLHLCGLKSYGIPYLLPSVSSEGLHYNSQKDYMTKWPISFMKERPIFTKKGARIRMKDKKKEK